jgi:protein-tyrosine phosphatase
MAEPERFYELVEMGVLGQLDAGSILGKFGKKVEETARVMLEHGLVHIIASDCHNTRNRLPGLSSAVAATAEVVGKELAGVMAEANPAAIVNGEVVPFRPDASYPLKKRRKWLFFL